jgi:beta-lactamase superfamily II metal-dependent hydrolase
VRNEPHRRTQRTRQSGLLLGISWPQFYYYGKQQCSPSLRFRRSDVITVEGEPEVTLRVLHPSAEGASANANDDSVVLRLEYGSTRILLAGDAEADAEAEMLRASLPYLRADVLNSLRRNR